MRRRYGGRIRRSSASHVDVSARVVYSVRPAFWCWGTATVAFFFRVVAASPPTAAVSPSRYFAPSQSLAPQPPLPAYDAPEAIADVPQQLWPLPQQQWDMSAAGQIVAQFQQAAAKELVLPFKEPATSFTSDLPTQPGRELDDGSNDTDDELDQETAPAATTDGCIHQNCGGGTCDKISEMYPQYTCDILETQYNCDCSGCRCESPTSSTQASTLLFDLLPPQCAWNRASFAGATKMELAAAGVGAWLFGYNRENFMFDKEQQLKREYQGQGMRIKQFELYREDVRDLIDLTVSKMDNYLIIATLQLGFCVTLFTEGRPQPGKSPFWMHWLYAVTTVSAFLYFLLAVWLAMHASIAAHSFGVRMLTQFVRLPVPNTQQLDAARALAQDFEAGRVRDMLRVPVLREQLRRLNEAMDNFTAQDGAGSDYDASSDAGSAAAERDANDPATRSFGAARPPANPAAMLRHMQLYRQLQANWQAYDAYARVCMFMGTNQLLHAMGYFCAMMLISENHAPWPALSCIVVFAVASWLLVRLDCYLCRRTLRAAAGLIAAPPVITVFCITTDMLEGVPRAVKDVGLMTVPIIFALHVVWIVFIAYMAKADHIEDVALPTKFRSVLYLDVFGWLAKEPRSADGVDDAADNSANDRDRGADRRFVGNLSAVTEGDGEDAEDPTESPVMFMREISGHSRLSRTGSMHQAMPPNLRASLLESCQRLASELRQDFARWESDGAQNYSDDFVKDLVSRLRARFDEIMSRDLDDELGHLESTLSNSNEQRRVWLKLEWNTSGYPMDFFYNCESQESIWEPPQEPDIISDIQDLERRLGEFAERARALAESPAAPPTPPPAEPAVSSTTANTGGFLSPPLPSIESRTDSDAGSTRQYLANHHEEDAANPNPAQEMRFGGRESVQLAEGSSMREQFFAHSAEAASTFHPHHEPLDRRVSRRTASRHRKPPGQMPWQTFLQGSIVLIIVWSVGTVWAFSHVYLSFDIPILPIVPDKPGFFARAPAPNVFFPGPWPHPFMQPRGLACHSSIGSSVLVAETYAVHEVHNDGSDEAQRLGVRPALSRCLAEAPEFQAGGIRDISVSCDDEPQLSSNGVGFAGRPAVSDRRCLVTLFSASNGEALQCAFQPQDPQRAPADAAAGVLTIHGSRWRTMAAGMNGTFWAIRGQDQAIVQLRRRLGSSTELVPEVEVPRAAAANVTSAHVHDSAFVLGLEATGRLHSWPLDGSSSRSWQLPQGMHWAGICSTQERLFFASTAHSDGRVEISSAAVPSELTKQNLVISE